MLYYGYIIIYGGRAYLYTAVFTAHTVHIPGENYSNNNNNNISYAHDNNIICVGLRRDEEERKLDGYKTMSTYYYFNQFLLYSEYIRIIIIILFVCSTCMCVCVCAYEYGAHCIHFVDVYGYTYLVSVCSKYIVRGRFMPSKRFSAERVSVCAKQ